MTKPAAAGWATVHSKLDELRASIPQPDFPSRFSDNLGPVDPDTPGHRGTAEVAPRSRISFLVAVLAVSLILRIVLVLSGGQNYWPDELRYDRSRLAMNAIWNGNWTSARQALGQADHLLFGVLGLLPATLERLTGSNPRIPALFFALFSVASILLVYAVMRSVGESERASCLGALLLAVATTHLYYSRHLLPYDAAMAFGLSSLYVGVQGPSRRASVLCGLLCCATFLTYNGYWLLAGFALLAHVASGPPTWRSCARRAIVAASAFAVPLAAILGADAAARGHLARDWANFSRTVSQGRYSEGWSLPFAYLWHAEHAIALLWVISLLYAASSLARGERAAVFMVGVAGIVFIYGGLVLMSVGLEKMVVYGRQARQLVPFACFLTAGALERIWTRAPRRRFAVATVLAGVLVQAAANFREPLTQVFPAEFRRLAERVAARGDASTLLLFAEHIYPTPAPVPAGAGPVVLARRHPLQFLPYQYEGYTPEERAALRSADIRMRLVLVVPRSPGDAPGK